MNFKKDKQNKNFLYIAHLKTQMQYKDMNGPKMKRNIYF